MALEDTMAQLAHSQITESLPSIVSDIQGFQIIDSNEEINSTVGILVGLVGNLIVYIPAIYRKGKIYNMDIMYIPEMRQWLPTQDNWLTYIRARRADLDAVIKERDSKASDGTPHTVELDKPLLQIVKTASAKFNDEYINKVGIRQALADAKEIIEHQLTTPVQSLNIPSTPELLKKCASEDTAKNVVLAISDSSTIGDALVQHYTDDEIMDAVDTVVNAVKPLTQIEPKVKGEVKILTSASKESRGLSDEEKACILRDGAVISDTRGLTPTKLFKTKTNSAWCTPAHAGVYELLKLDGSTVTAYVVPAGRVYPEQYNPSKCCFGGATGATSIVVPLDDSMKRNAYVVNGDLLGQGIPVCDFSVSGGVDIQGLSENGDFLVADKGGTAFVVTLNNISHIGADGDYMVRCNGGRIGAPTALEYSHGFMNLKDCGRGGLNVLIPIPEGGKLRHYNDTLYVPEGCRFFKLTPEGFGDNKSLNLATFSEYEEASKRRHKLLSIKVYRDVDSFVVSDESGKISDPLTKTAAAFELVKNYAIAPTTASKVLNELGRNTAQRYLAKMASATSYSLTVGDGDASDTQRHDVDLTGIANSNQTADQIKDQLTKASQTGVKEIMDVTVLKVLAEDGSCVRIIQDLIPSLFTALNTVGQLLFMLRAGMSMSEAYGEYRANEMEVQFTRLMQRLGDAIIVLQQGKIGDVKDLLEGPLSSTLG